MRIDSRKVVDRATTGLGLLSIVLVAGALIVLLAPIVYRGLGAFVFRATVEHRRAHFDHFRQGNRAALEAELAAVAAARQPVYDALAAQAAAVRALPRHERRAAQEHLEEVRTLVRALLGPLPGDPEPALIRDRYGARRWDRAAVALHNLLYVTAYDYSDPTRLGRKQYVPRVAQWRGTALEPLFAYCAARAEDMLRPRWTFYWRFLTDDSRDAHMIGGIWAELLGTFYLTVGAILFAVPMGVLSAIYLVEYARDNWAVRALRSCISTLAGVPSIVFGLFGLAFFINTLRVSPSKSVLAGSLTLAALILPLVIRAAEEAIRAVPQTYKEAALSVGASRWRTILTVILPAALPGILTGVVISMGRAAGETAPIIFTAAVSVGPPLAVWQTLSSPTPALPWNIYNLATEHAAADEIRHVQYGMVLTLVVLVLVLNGAAIILRARIARRLTG